MEDGVIIPNYKNFLNKEASGWKVIACDEMPAVYIIVLTKENLERIFYIRRPIIKGKEIYKDEDFYELWYKDFEEAKLLTTSEIIDIDCIFNKIKELLEKYSKYN